MSGNLTNVTVQLVVGGSPINIKTVEVELTKTKKSETFHATAAMFDPATAGFDGLANSTVQVMINGAQIGGDFILDHPEFDFDATEIKLSGRDSATSTLVDTQNTQSYLNQTPNQVVQSLANGIPVDMDDVSQTAGKTFDNSNWSAITHRAQSWDAIQNIADLNGKNAYITGGMVYVKDINEQLPSYAVNWSPPSEDGFATCNVLSLKCRQDGPMSKTHNVKVSSHNYKQKQTLNATATAGGSAPGTRNYNYVVPSSTQDQLQSIATKKANEHAKHGFNVSVEIPGDVTIVARMSLALSGTSTVFDQTYDMETVKHSAEFGGGYKVAITGKTQGGGGSSSGGSSGGDASS